MSNAFKSYDPDIADNATDGIWKKRECKWTATLATQQLIQSCKCGYCYFNLKVVDDTWVRRICDPDWFYTSVSFLDLLDFLSTHSVGLERADVVAMFAMIPLWWAEDPWVLEFINRFDDTQKKANQASLPITDNWLAAMATSALLSTNSFLNDFPA